MRQDSFQKLGASNAPTFLFERTKEEKEEEVKNEIWQQERSIRFTASQISKLLGKSINTQTFQTYLFEKIAGKLGCKFPKVQSASLAWGNEYESEAISKVNEVFDFDATGNQLFTHNKHEFLGGSPDGLDLSKKLVLEVKCPYAPANHIRHLLLKDQEDLKKKCFEYYAQLQCNMLIQSYNNETDFSGVFCSYDPRYSNEYGVKLIELSPDFELWDLIEERSIEANKLLNKLLKEICLKV